MSGGDESTFSVLVVCTGNVCRSPLAERLILGRLGGIEGVSVTSAGTRALVLEDMTPETAALVDGLGGATGAHRARLLTAELVAEADLVLTAAREHRSEVVSLHPRAARYTYTLTQFARLLEALRADASARSALTEDAVENLRSLVEDAAALRGFVRAADPGDDDIEDPYRRSSAVYERVGGVVDHACAEIASAISAVVRAR